MIIEVHNREGKKEKELLRICSKQQSTSNTLCTELFGQGCPGAKTHEDQQQLEGMVAQQRGQKCRAASSLELVTEGTGPFFFFSFGLQFTHHLRKPSSCIHLI